MLKDLGFFLKDYGFDKQDWLIEEGADPGICIHISSVN
jgi:hypothetical protein